MHSNKSFCCRALKIGFCSLQIGDKGGNITSALRQLYQKHLLPFEEFAGCCTREKCSSERYKRKVSEDLAVGPAGETSNRSFSEEAGTQAAEIITELKASKEGWAERSPKRQRLDGAFGSVEVRAIWIHVLLSGQVLVL